MLAPIFCEIVSVIAVLGIQFHKVVTLMVSEDLCVNHKLERFTKLNILRHPRLTSITPFKREILGKKISHNDLLWLVVMRVSPADKIIISHKDTHCNRKCTYFSILFYLKLFHNPPRGDT